MLIPVIAQYLRSHRRLIIPQMGAFIVKEPGRSVLFSELLKRDDGVLRSLLVAAGSSELEAGGEIDRFVFEVRHAIQQGREFPLEGLGVLKPGPNETIAFTYQPQPAEPTEVPDASATAAVASNAPVTETAAPNAAATTAPATAAIASNAPTAETAATAAPSAEPAAPAAEAPARKVAAAAVETLYGSERPAQASGPAIAFETPKPSEPRPTAASAASAVSAAHTAPATPIAERRFSGRADFASSAEQSGHPQFKSLSLPKRTRHDDTLVDSCYGRLPRRPAIEQTVRVKKRSDHFIWIALAAALIALGAIAFGQWCDKFGREGDEVILEHVSNDNGYMPSGR